MKELSFVILTWNSERYIAGCLTALRNALATFGAAYEVFIVDNGSQDGTVALLETFRQQQPEQITPILLDHNTGTTYSRNLALRQATGRYVCVMDSDVELAAGVIEELIQTFARDPQIGLVAPKLLYPSGQLQKSTDVFPTVMTKAFRFFFLKIVEARAHHAAPPPRVAEVDYAISALWLLKHAVIETVGLLDEQIVYSPEDVDYCLRIWQAGYKIVYNPTVACVHHTQEISRGFRLNHAQINHVRGLAYYFRKHHYLFTRPKHLRRISGTL